MMYLLLGLIGVPYGLAAVLAFAGPILVLVAAVKSNQEAPPVSEQLRDESVRRNEEIQRETLEAHMKALQEISISLERIVNVKEVLGVEKLLPSFYTCIFYDLVFGASNSREEKHGALTMLLECCPASLGISGHEVFNHIEENDSVGQLILAMKSYPLVILDLANKTGRKEDGDRFLQAFAAAFIAAGEVCNQAYPGKNFQGAARKACKQWMDYLSEKIEG